jgi:sulfide:quinone oxidoreductase
MANKLAPALSPSEWQITLIDPSDKHYYQPGFLFIPFGIYTRDDVIKPSRDFYPTGVEVITVEVEEIQAAESRIKLADGRMIGYDYLIVATGARVHPEETEGMMNGAWHQNIFDFYTIEGACSLARFFKYWEGGRLVVNIAEMPIKCPVAPLEFAFLADWWFTERGMRDKVHIELVTPLPGAFTKPIASHRLGEFMERKNIHLTSEFAIGRVDSNTQKIVSWDDREVEYDLLVTIPVHRGAEVIQRSGLGDELDFVPTDPHTLRSKQYENIFVIGDATDVPTSKAGSVAHFESDILIDNIQRAIENRPLKADYDGHANCFIESGFGKGVLIDFNYQVEPLPGKFPLPGVGPFSLLEETRMNHWGKMTFRWVYWNLLLKGAEMPVQSRMLMAGKMKP